MVSTAQFSMKIATVSRCSSSSLSLFLYYRFARSVVRKQTFLRLSHNDVKQNFISSCKVHFIHNQMLQFIDIRIETKMLNLCQNLVFSDLKLFKQTNEVILHQTRICTLINETTSFVSLKESKYYSSKKNISDWFLFALLVQLLSFWIFTTE